MRGEAALCAMRGDRGACGSSTDALCSTATGSRSVGASRGATNGAGLGPLLPPSPLAEAALPADTDDAAEVADPTRFSHGAPSPWRAATVGGVSATPTRASSFSSAASPSTPCGAGSPWGGGTGVV